MIGWLGGVLLFWYLVWSLGFVDFLVCVLCFVSCVWFLGFWWFRVICLICYGWFVGLGCLFYLFAVCVDLFDVFLYVGFDLSGFWFGWFVFVVLLLGLLVFCCWCLLVGCVLGLLTCDCLVLTVWICFI